MIKLCKTFFSLIAFHKIVTKSYGVIACLDDTNSFTALFFVPKICLVFEIVLEQSLSIYYISDLHRPNVHHVYFETTQTKKNNNDKNHQYLYRQYLKYPCNHIIFLSSFCMIGIVYHYYNISIRSKYW